MKTHSSAKEPQAQYSTPRKTTKCNNPRAFTFLQRSTRFGDIAVLSNVEVYGAPQHAA
jgi:hypothetical protein